MREATDLSISAGVRRELAGRRIDLSKLKFPVKAAVVSLEGEFCFNGIEKDDQETAIELKFIYSSLKNLQGVKEIQIDLSNWRRTPNGSWEPIGRKMSGSKAFGHSSAKGLVCPECDSVIRFCPCCGKPLSEDAKAGHRPIRRPFIPPPAKRPLPIAPQHAPEVPDTQVDTIVASPQTPRHDIKPVMPISQPTPLPKPDSPPIEQAAPPLKPSLPPQQPEQQSKPSISIPTPVSPIGSVTMPAIQQTPTKTPVPTPVQPKPQVESPAAKPIVPIKPFTLPTKQPQPEQLDTPVVQPMPAPAASMPQPKQSEQPEQLDTPVVQPMPAPAASMPQPKQSEQPEQLDSPVVQPMPVPATAMPQPEQPEQPNKPEVQTAPKMVEEKPQVPPTDSLFDLNNLSLDTVPQDSKTEVEQPDDDYMDMEGLLPPLKSNMADPAKKPASDPLDIAFDLDITPKTPQKPAETKATTPTKLPIPPAETAKKDEATSFFDLDDDTQDLFPPPKPKEGTPAANTEQKPAESDPFASLLSGFEESFPQEKVEKDNNPFGDLSFDFNTLEIPSDPTPQKKTSANENPFDLDNIFDLDLDLPPLKDTNSKKDKEQKTEKPNLDDFNLDNFKF